jgi:methylated-DNA-[protein]-cysteine S-methyltransferase
MPVQTFSVERLSTPTGAMLILTDDADRLRAADWEDHEQRMQTLLQRHYRDDTIQLRAASAPSSARHSLEAYFSGDIGAVGTNAVATGGTEFQRAVWDALRRIPAGQTMSYGALAAAIGRPKAVRAVGLANGANPIAVFVPCHRVIGADNSLTGYGGGLERKRWLLQHEQTAKTKCGMLP